MNNSSISNLRTFSFKAPTATPPFCNLWDILYPPFNMKVSIQAKNTNKPNLSSKQPRKFSCKYPIAIENEGSFQVSRKIIGAKGCNMKKIIDLTLNEYQFKNLESFNEAKLIKLRLRGKGSGFMEGRKNSGNF